MVGVGLLDGERETHTGIRGQAQDYAQDESLENLPQACNKANEETSPGPLLVT